MELGDICVEVTAGQAVVTLLADSSFPRWPQPEAAGAQKILDGSPPTSLEAETAPLSRSRFLREE